MAEFTYTTDIVKVSFLLWGFPLFSFSKLFSFFSVWYRIPQSVLTRYGMITNLTIIYHQHHNWKLTLQLNPYKVQQFAPFPRIFSFFRVFLAFNFIPEIFLIQNVRPFVSFLLNGFPIPNISKIFILEFSPFS